MHGPCGSGPAQASDVVIFDTPRGDLVEISSSSYGLSLFSLKASSRQDGGVGAVPRGVIEHKHGWSFSMASTT
jgi:hypothetical protein